MQRNLLPFLTLCEAAKLIKVKEISPVELVESFLERIHRLNGELNSYITICSEEAVKDAQRLEDEISRGIYRGPLHGIPIAVKDQLKTKGIRTTNGSRVFADYFPLEDATVIGKLKEAGFILLGKLNLSEFAIGGTRVHPYGTPRNPWDLTRNPGESSSGSAAAVAASLCCAAIGEDTGGSIRWPASWCGSVGLRPSAGRVSRYAIFPLCWSMDTAGPITKTTEDAAVLLQAIAGYDPKDASSLNVPVPDYTALLGKSIKGLKLGRVIEYCDSGTNDKDIQGSLNRAMRTLQELGAHIQDVSIPLLSLAAPIFVCTADVDFAHAWEEILRTRAQELDSHTRTRCLSALLTPANLYHKGQRARRLLREKVIEALQSVDALISPTGPKPSQRIASLVQPFRTKEDVRRVMFESRSYMSAYSLSGLPAITIPCGFTESNLPIGLQIAGRPFTEDVLFQIAHAFESATEYHLRRPPLH